MNEYSKQKLSKRNKNTAKQTNKQDQRNIWHK